MAQFINIDKEKIHGKMQNRESNKMYVYALAGKQDKSSIGD